ncbi:MAG TPA: NADH-quinone oxidoreductase subunit L [Terriglobales bacterium]|jgi:NADH-quinone oxidoreductase subunit L|nr:NADH-quinone oxidoreductase subunit L [Terriglobales bacterium]
MTLHLWAIPVLPALGAAINGLLGRRFSKASVAAVGLVSVGASFLVSLWVAWQFRGLSQDHIPHVENYATWLRAGSFSADFGAYLDQLSLVMILVVTGVGFLIHVYSVGYMWEEGGFYRYFSYLNLFMFFMLTLVLANNYLLMFVGWEGVGLASYLLIGFWFRRDSAASAGKKAFIVNRIGDCGFLIGLFLLIKHFGTLDFAQGFRSVSALPAETAGAGLLTAVALLLFVGATGKSAQVPLYVWLPDAMEGPTPVSALIHAATMVTAGVYMVARSSPIFDRAPTALAVVAVIGCVTALLAATIGMAQTDIKRVLAYSTISQLGYMFLACGVAAYSAAIFHLMTHAFFKGLLFLAAGSVIHALAGEQDMRRMGGLRKKIPVTFWTMTAGMLAIAGLPLFSGFFSKDQILWKAWSSPYGSHVYWAVAVVTALLTSFYMFRLWFLTFFGEFRGPQPRAAGPHTHLHESPWVMLGPLVALAILSVIGGYVGVPHALGGDNYFDKFLSPVFKASADAMPAGAHPGEPMQQAAAEHAERNLELLFTAVSVGAALLGLLLAWLLYYRRRDLPESIAGWLGGIYGAVRDKYYVDEAYNALFVQPVIQGSSRLLWRGIDAATIDGAVNQSAESAQDISDALRRMQSGNVRSYAGWVALGAAIVVAYMIWQGAR